MRVLDEGLYEGGEKKALTMRRRHDREEGFPTLPLPSVLLAAVVHLSEMYAPVAALPDRVPEAPLHGLLVAIRIEAVAFEFQPYGRV